MNEKQNMPVNKPPTPLSTRKYIYGQSAPTSVQQPGSALYSSTSTPRQQSQSSYTDLQNKIRSLELQLQQQKQKVKYIEENTIREQTQVLNQIEILENRFMQVENQKQEMKQLLQQSYTQIQQYKKIKGIAQAMVNMMNKVQHKSQPNPNSDYHQAWRWIKKVIWEYQSIKKKGLQWKRAYDAANHSRSNTFSNDSDYSSDIQQQ